MYREPAPPAVRTRAEAGKSQEQPLPRTEASRGAGALRAGPAGRALLAESGETHTPRTDRLHPVGRKRQHHPAASAAPAPVNPSVQEFAELLHPHRRRVAHRFGVAHGTGGLSCDPHVPARVQHSNELLIFIQSVRLPAKYPASEKRRWRGGLQHCFWQAIKIPPSGTRVQQRKRRVLACGDSCVAVSCPATPET